MGFRISNQLAMNFDELVIDSFAGGGGASTGIEAAIGRPIDIAINHDQGAISMHLVNHPQTRHYCESVWKVDPRKACEGRPVGLAWFSPDCTHFSKAKGGKPVKKEIRGLAWIVLRWAATVRPRVIILENVEEFKTWGPIGKDSRPCPDQKGKTFTQWKSQLAALGYEIEHRELRACDYGAPTIRKRLFIIARCDGLPIIWPQPTHGPGTDNPYRTAADIIDWSIPCPSIFERKRPLADATLRRIARGIQRLVIDNPDPFIVTYYGRDTFRGLPLDQSLPTQTTENRFALVTPVLTEHANASSPRCWSADEPLRTQVASIKGGHFALLAPVIDRQFGESRGNRADAPLGTITAGGQGKAAVVSAFLAKHYGGGYTGPGHKLQGQTGTITTVDHHALVTSHMVKLRGTCRDGQKIDQPAPTVTASGTHIGEVRAFLLKYYGNEKDGCSLGEPIHTVPTRDRFALVTYQGNDYQIVDIGMRMLSPRELFRAQGFPDDYIIDRDADGKPITKTEQVRRCGNSVCPPVAEALVRANMAEQKQMRMEVA